MNKKWLSRHSSEGVWAIWHSSWIMEKLNSIFSVAKSMGVDFGWHSLWEHCAKQQAAASRCMKSYDTLTTDNQEEV